MANIKQIEVDSTTYDIKDAKANIAYGTCSTAAGTAAKVITVTDNASWALTAGSIITILFSDTNTANNPTFNVNSTGAKNVYYGTSQITTSSLSYAGYKNRLMTFMYDGTQYRFVCWGVDNNTTYTNASLGQGYATCSTAEATTAKVGTLSSYALTTGGVVAVKFTYAVPASATLNINSKGAKAIYYKGAAITAGVIKAGDVATFIYNGSQYHLLTVDRSASEFVKSGNGARSGLVPAPPTTAGTTKYLREDGNWVVPPDTNTTYDLGSFGITATATELNYVDGVTSNIQTQLNGKAASSHNHAASNITSGTLGIDRGGTGKATHTSNAVLTGNGTSAVNNVATASGALYATSTNGAAKFGTLPIAQGGTGATTAANALTNLGAASSAEVYYFTTKYAKDNYISDVLQINTDGNCDSAYMRDGYVDENSANMQELRDIYDIRTDFTGYRQVFVIPVESGIINAMVKVTELYPRAGREYFRRYTDSGWLPWHHRDIESFSMISFTIDGERYVAHDNMTWEEWVNSRYNIGFYISDGHPMKKVGVDEYVVSDSSGWVQATRTMTNGGTYTLSQYV